MSRKIILLSDGTGNSAAKVWRTNVWRTFEALDLSGSDQVAYYDDGVGTSSFKPWAILGGAFGFGLKRNVISIYKFACRNCRNDDSRAADRIYAFGFSRGAFTIRVVLGLILSEGLVQADNEADLDRYAKNAYRQYRRKKFHTQWSGRPEDMLRDIRDGAIWLWRWPRDRGRPERSRSQHFQIRFVGLWDTVAAYGMPIDEMTRGISNWIWPLEFPNHRFDRARVARGCHALSLDEERTTFHPELWDERTVPPTQTDISRRRFIADEQISQVWFPGVHANVGGGYPDDSLAYIPLVWIITEARRCGLKFKSDYSNDPTNWSVMRSDPDTFKNAISKRDKDGRLYDPRKGIGGYYRYGPRKLVLLCTPQFTKKEDDEVVVERPKIHESVFKRIKNHAHAYAPVGLPAIYDVVTDDGEIVTPDQYRDRLESNDGAEHRANAQEHVWNEIWKRRIVYFLTVAATAWLLIFPLIDDVEKNAETYSQIRWVSDLIRLIGKFFPGFTSTWIEGYAHEPWHFLISAAVVGAFLKWGATIADRIKDDMSAIWQRPHLAPRDLPKNWIYRLRSDKRYICFHEKLKRRWAPAFFAVAFIYLGAAIVNRIFYNVQDIAGFTCVDAIGNPKLSTPQSLDRDDTLTVPFTTSDFCARTGIWLESNGAQYRVEIAVAQTPEEQWKDWWISIPPGGFSSVDQVSSRPAGDPPSTPNQSTQAPKANQLIVTPPWYYRPLMMWGTPLRRTLSQDWFRIALRYGSVGGEEDFYRPDIHDTEIRWIIKPKREGELFVYVNDAVIGIPGMYDLFYQNNHGSGKLSVKRIR
jgi:uncharacterized protein (DUF2235 family)